MSRGWALLLLCAGLSEASDSLHYPPPPNPFASSPPPVPDPNALPPPPSLIPPRPPEPTSKKPGRRPFRLRWQPVVCMGVLSAVCFKTRPHEPLLLSTLDAYQQAAGGLVQVRSLGEATNFQDLGLASVALHSDLIWIGLLGAWLPLLPVTRDAIAHWLPAVGAPQVLVMALTVGYLLRKLLPRSAADSLLSVSFSNIAKMRIWTLVTAAFSPVGLVHWLHSIVVILSVMPSLSASLSRPEQMILYASAGAAASLSAVVGGLLFRHRKEPRAAVSGAIMGVLLMRAAIAPEETVTIGEWSIPVLRAVLLHFILDSFSNS
ncbi:MAG: hypothetical protein SGPRY_006647 [Prymnesium sp.]